MVIYTRVAMYVCSLCVHCMFCVCVCAHVCACMQVCTKFQHVYVFSIIIKKDIKIPTLSASYGNILTVETKGCTS